MSKEYDHFWKYHNKDNMDVHAVMLIRKLEAKNEKLESALERIQTWAKAYPLDVFPKPDLKKAAKVLKAAGMTLDAISADAMRHVLDSIKDIVEQTLSKDKDNE